MWVLKISFFLLSLKPYLHLIVIIKKINDKNYDLQKGKAREAGFR